MYQLAIMAYLSTPYRTAMALIFILHTFAGAPWQEAYQEVQEHEKFAPYLPDIAEKKGWRAMEKSAIRWGNRFLKYGAVHTKKRVRMRSMAGITPDEAKLASFLLKTGWTEYEKLHGRVYEIHHYFSSLKQALRKSPQLKAIYEKYHVAGEAKKRREFMQQLYKYDKLLRIRRRHIKYALSEELMARRQTRAKSLLARAATEPDFLERIFFVDECAIIFDHEIAKGVHVYCDAHDKGYRFVIPFKKAKPNQQIKVRVLAAVNYHTGAFFLELQEAVE